MLQLTIKDKGLLYSNYMPFIEKGGMFIATPKKYNLGDEVFILLTLMDEPERIPVSGKVVWITPQGSQGNRPAGIGIQFTMKDETARHKIEKILTGSLDSDRANHTM
jgi:type IV pilus assembly protein PilZ